METVFEFLGSFSLLGMGLQSWGLLLDGIGFMMVFYFGGTTFLGSDGTSYNTGPSLLKLKAGSKLIHLPYIGAVIVVIGFALQFLGSVR